LEAYSAYLQADVVAVDKEAQGQGAVSKSGVGQAQHFL
jgi:hypothetical protein